MNSTKHWAAGPPIFFSFFSLLTFFFFFCAILRIASRGPNAHLLVGVKGSFYFRPLLTFFGCVCILDRYLFVALLQRCNWRGSVIFFFFSSHFLGLPFVIFAYHNCLSRYRKSVALPCSDGEHSRKLAGSFAFLHLYQTLQAPFWLERRSGCSCSLATIFKVFSYLSIIASLNAAIMTGNLAVLAPSLTNQSWKLPKRPQQLIV